MAVSGATHEKAGVLVPVDMYYVATFMPWQACYISSPAIRRGSVTVTFAKSIALRSCELKWHGRIVQHSTALSGPVATPFLD